MPLPLPWLGPRRVRLLAEIRHRGGFPAEMGRWLQHEHPAGQRHQRCLYQWFDSLSADDQQSFADAWPLIKADAETLLTDKDSMTGRIEDAGLDAKELPGCSEENWKALADVIDVLVPASSEY